MPEVIAGVRIPDCKFAREAAELLREHGTPLLFAMAGIYPVWLRPTLDPAHSLTATNSAATSYRLQVALVWRTIGIASAGEYFVILFRSTLGKVDVHAEGHGYE
jgi:hypothetical protein